MNTADFYTMDHDGSLEWLGSVFNNGSINQIPLELLIVADLTSWEENVNQYVYNRFQNGILKDNGDHWPWDWDDSKLTEYVYIYDVCKSNVIMIYRGSRAVDPIKLLQGMDMIGADNGMGIIDLPLMRDREKELAKEMTEEYYGSKPAKAV